MAFDSATPAPLGPPDWTSLGLVLALVGCFLLANGILLRSPRALVAERLGRAPQHLRHLREFVFHRVQMGLGFGFLVCGFAAQLYGHLQPAPAPAERDASSPVMWIGLVVVLAVVLELAGWWWSVHSLRGHVRAVLRENPPDFETDPNLAREIGELFGIDSGADETVQSYAQRLRAGLKIATTQRGPRARNEERPGYAQRSGFGEETEAGFEDL